MKVSFENHEQDPHVVVNHLEELKRAAELSPTELIKINQLQQDLVRNDYKQTTEEKYQNPLARRSESELPIVLLHNPTSAMMASVKRVSDELLKIIEDQGEDFKYSLRFFLENTHVIALGALKDPITIDTIKELLQNNDPTKLAEIMHIHFKFAQCLTRDIPIKHAPRREPTGKLAEIVKSIWSETDDPKDFFSNGLAKDWQGRKYRAYISDELMYRSDLYTAPGNRGRGGLFDSSRTNQLGLMLNGQEEYEMGLPKHETSRWSADCKSQPANYASPYVLDLVENDAVYVAGPSGMTSIFLGQMEILANFENENLKKNYLSAVVSYIVGGGFHSLHEVIGPAENALGLVPGYKVQVPSYDHRAPAPNYNQFFAQQELIDPDFAARRELAWQNYLNYVTDSYAPKHIEGFQHEEINFSQPDVETHDIAKENTPLQDVHEIPKQLDLEVNHIIEEDVLKPQTTHQTQEELDDNVIMQPDPHQTVQPLNLEVRDIGEEDASRQQNQHPIPTELKNAVLREINNYIKDGALSRGNKEEQLSFISKVFRNPELTRKKLDIAIGFRKAIQSDVTTIEELKGLVAQLKQKNLSVEQDAGKTYGLFTKSGLNRAMESIDENIANFEHNLGNKNQHGIL